MEENYQQMSLWDLIYPRKIIDKPIRLIELFAGIGAQHKALKQLTDQVESWKICEWSYNSYCSYNAIHIKDFTDYSQNLSKEELIEKVRGTSTNYNEPLTDKQLKQKPIEWLRNAYNNIVATHNLINIMEVHGKDLEIVDTDKYEYIMTYSFPCQDLSLAGKRQGMGVSQKDGGTRSGLLWEVERILTECKELGTLPQILLMENVPQIHGEGAKEDFNKWQLRLEELGYKNYWQDLIATDYGIPQTRNRCFMVSILGDYNYTFPKPIPLKLKLKDMLENNVDEKYYLSDKMIDFFTHNEEKQKENGNGFRFNVSDGNIIAKTITTRAGSRMDDNFIKIKNATKKGYKVDHDGDGVDIGGRMASHRGTVQKGLAQTLKTNCDVGVVVNEENTKKYKNYITWRNKKGEFNTECNRASPEDGLALTIPTKDQTKVALSVGGSKLRIRKLTPKECIRLMGFTDEDYEAMRSIGMTDSAIYHMAGDSIVVTVLIGIFSQLMEEDKHKKVIPDYIKKGIVEK